MLTLSGRGLTPEQLRDALVSSPGSVAQVDPDAWARVAAGRESLLATVARRRVYGRNTGVGANHSTTVSADEWGLSLLRSHAGGAGAVLDASAARAMMLVRANQLLVGTAGVEVALIQALVAAINAGAYPSVHEFGSIGTGDLTALAELALTLLGERPWVGAGPAPFAIDRLDALALLSSSALTIAQAALAYCELVALADAAVVVAALSLVALGGSIEPFADPVQQAKPHPGAGVVATRIRELTAADAPTSERVQDPFGLRVLAPVHGVLLDSLDRLRAVLMVELNAGAENPLVAIDAGDVYHHGNFHLAELAGALDDLRLSLLGSAQLGTTRISSLLDPQLTGLGAFLADRPGGSGLMIAEYTAASALAALRAAAMPVAFGAAVISRGVESHASFAGQASRQAADAIAAYQSRSRRRAGNGRARAADGRPDAGDARPGGGPRSGRRSAGTWLRRSSARRRPRGRRGRTRHPYRRLSVNSVAGPVFDSLWDDIADVGRASGGGYERFAWTDVDRTLRDWFAAAARSRGMSVEVDRNGNQWAWWGDPDFEPGIVIGSHLDSVPNGGAFDGPLGVVSSLAAIDVLRAESATPARPIGVVNFVDEEGARFGVACAGSRLLTGEMTRQRAGELTDRDGISWLEAAGRAGIDQRKIGRDDLALQRIGAFVELHVEQGRGLVDLNQPLAVASSIWPHGRWLLELAGEANHAGTTRLVDRHDPMITYARAVLEARAAATRLGAVATCGKVLVTPNGVNAIPSHIAGSLDARGPNADDVRAVVAAVEVLVRAEGGTVSEQSWTGETTFDPALRDQLTQALGAPPVMATGAGHDAGILAAAGVPTAMLFVRNPTGISHSPAEFAERSDCLVGVDALVTVLKTLA